jgi:UDP-3-O-acyl-N-acetylglucosamine deacetylase
VWSNLLDFSIAHKNRGSLDDALAIENSRIFDQDILRSEEAVRHKQK